MESPAAEPLVSDSAPPEPLPDSTGSVPEDGAAECAFPSVETDVAPKAEDHCETEAPDAVDAIKKEIVEEEGADPLSLCRICMSAPSSAIDIFDDADAILVREKLMSCAAVQISRLDGLPERICRTCVDDLEVAYNFKTRCERSDAVLRERLGLKTKTIVKTEFVLIDCDDDVADRATRRSRAKKRIGDDFIEEEDFSVQETDDPSYETQPKRRKIRRKRKSIVPKIEIEPPREESDDSDDDEDDVALMPRGADVPPKKRKSYSCNDCDKTFPYPSSLKAHAIIHTKKKENKCMLCPKAFVYTKELYAHYKIAHPNGSKKLTSEEPPKSFPCSLCDKVFGESKNLKVHEAMHTREKKYTCEGCSLGFTNMTVLNTHKKREHPELCRPYSCNMCNRSFKHMTALERHIEYHKMNDTNKAAEKKPPLVKDLFKSIAPLTTTYWSDSFSD